MYKIHKRARVPYSAEQMFALVEDVERYPLFLPWCCAARLERGAQRDEVTAELTIARGGARLSFATRNRLLRTRAIDMTLERGPLRALEGRWTFAPCDGGGSQIALTLEFAFANRWVDAAIGPLFSHIAATLVAAFEERAQRLYGEASGGGGENRGGEPQKTTARR